MHHWRVVTLTDCKYEVVGMKYGKGTLPKALMKHGKSFDIMERFLLSVMYFFIPFKLMVLVHKHEFNKNYTEHVEFC